MTRMTPPRRAVLEHLAEEGEANPFEIAGALGRSPGSTRELLRQMVGDGHLVSQIRGRFGPLRAAPDALPDVTADEFTGETDPRESVAVKPTEGEIWAYSEADGGMVPNAVMRRRKGYSGPA